MLSEEIEHQAKKEKKPEPGTYDPKSKERLLGALNLKDDRTTFADEALHLGKKVVPPYDSKFELVYDRCLTARIHPPTKVEPRVKKNEQMPEPGTYNMDNSFK